MDELRNKSNTMIQNTSLKIVRQLPLFIDFEWRLNGIVGSRGTGKTTRMLQQLKMLQLEGKKVLYVTLDDFYFAKKNPYELALEFAAMGGEYLYFDEVHKFENWGVYIKNIYDSEPRLKVLFSGSSILQVNEHNADLSRRALMYDMPVLSFREFLFFKHKLEFPKYTLDAIVKNHVEIAGKILEECTPLLLFKEYLQGGMYPFFMEKNRNVRLSLEQIIKYILEVDFNLIKGYQGGQYYKLMHILLTIAQNPPFELNTTKLSQAVGLNRNTLVNYLHYMFKANLTSNLNFPQTSLSNLTKPDKILLQDPNMYYCLCGNHVEIGSVRESFAANQLRNAGHSIFLHKETDFEVGKYHFEIGGRNKKKNSNQKKLKNMHVLKDDIEMGSENTIPLYLLGLMY